MSKPPHCCQLTEVLIGEGKDVAPQAYLDLKDFVRLLEHSARNTGGIPVSLQALDFAAQHINIWIWQTHALKPDG